VERRNCLATAKIKRAYILPSTLLNIQRYKGNLLRSNNLPADHSMRNNGCHLVIITSGRQNSLVGFSRRKTISPLS